MKSLKDIKKLVTKFKVKPTSEMKSRVLDEALQMQRNQQLLLLQPYPARPGLTRP